MTTETTPRIDAHMHLFEVQSPQYPRGVHPLYPADMRAPLDAYLENMERHGIDRAVMVSLDDHDEYARECQRRTDGRLGVVGVVREGALDPAADFAERHAAMPMVGFRIWSLGEKVGEEWSFLPLMKELERSGVAAWFYGSPDQLRQLPQALEACPDLIVVLNHLGFCQQGFLVDDFGRPRVPNAIPPETFDITLALAQLPQVAVMFSGHYAFSGEDYPYRDLRGVSTALVDAYGPERLLWASDWPWIQKNPGYAAITDLVDDHLPGLTPDQRANILGGNAARILRWENDAPPP